MNKLRIKKKTDRKILWRRFEYYINFVIIACCLVIAFNVHLNDNSNNYTSSIIEKSKMIYVFHDYEGNVYILNDTIHGAADSWDYLFDDEVPDSIKRNDDSTGTASLWDWSSGEDTQTGKTIDNKSNDDTIKDNQVSLEDIMNDLWIDDNIEDNHNVDNTTNISDTTEISLNEWDDDWTRYSIKEEYDANNSTLTIEKLDIDSNTPTQNNNVNNEDLLSAKSFTFTSDGWVIPILIPWDELYLNRNTNNEYDDNFKWRKDSNKNSDSYQDGYSDCMTPWWYKIAHWDSVLAYQQMDNAPDICNIERRFCWKGKLSWTYTQQWCSINENYTYEQWWEATPTQKEKEPKYKTTQNPDWTVTVNDTEIGGAFVFDKPSQTSTPSYNLSDNVKPEDEEVDQTKRPTWDCTAPRWEKVKHGQFVQAFRHSNWFSDAPCEAQLRLCTMWDLIWSYTESSCKTWDTSFIDWINGSPTRETYSKEKLDWVREQINQEINYNKWLRRFSNSDELEKILNILDE